MNSSYDSYDIWIQPGSTFNLSLYATNQSGIPLNLSGYSIQGFVRYGYGNTGYLLDLSPIVDGVITGQIDISVTSSLTSGLPITKAVYDVIAISSGYSFRVVKGYANISPEVSLY